MLVVVQTLILWIFCSIEVSATDLLGHLHMWTQRNRADANLCSKGIEKVA